MDKETKELLRDILDHGVAADSELGIRVANLLWKHSDMAARLTEFANEWADKIYLEDAVSVEIKVGTSYHCEPFDGDTFRITIPRTATEKAVKKTILCYIISAYFQDPAEYADSEEERLELGAERITDVMYSLLEKSENGGGF